jgi:predicted O-methyltransferase YrrM
MTVAATSIHEIKPSSELFARTPILESILSTGQTLDETGATVQLRSNVPAAYAEALYRTVRAEGVSRAVEVGMACGVSSLAILAGLADRDGATLVSIDPNQSREWHRAGRSAVERAGFGSRHRLIEQPSYLALPHLVAEGTTVDFVYIDGWHTFDYTLIDFFFADRLLRPGGIVAFNDCSWPAIDKAIRFVKTHRKYEELDVGLEKTPVVPAWESRRVKIVRACEAALGLPSRYRVGLGFAQDRYFRKLATWEPTWNFYEDF